jgi:hypothetical protein
MVIRLKRSYPSLHKDGENKGQRKFDKNHQPITVFVYQVTGTDEELKKYEEIQIKAGVKTVKDQSGYLWFTTVPVGVTGKLNISTNGKIFADTTAMDLASQMIKQYGELGRIMAKDIMDKGFIPDDEPIEMKEPDLDDLG